MKPSDLFIIRSIIPSNVFQWNKNPVRNDEVAIENNIREFINEYILDTYRGYVLEPQTLDTVRQQILDYISRLTMACYDTDWIKGVKVTAHLNEVTILILRSK